MNFNLNSKFESEEFAQIKLKIKSSIESVNNLKDDIICYDDILTKIKDPKSLNPLDYLKTMSYVAKYSESSKTKVLSNI